MATSLYYMTHHSIARKTLRHPQLDIAKLRQLRDSLSSSLGRRNAVHKSGWQTVTPEKQRVCKTKAPCDFSFSPPSWRYPTLTDETVELLPQTWDTVCGLQFGQIFAQPNNINNILTCPEGASTKLSKVLADFLRYPNPGRSRALSPEQRPWHHPRTLGHQNHNLAMSDKDGGVRVVWPQGHNMKRKLQKVDPI